MERFECLHGRIIVLSCRCCQTLWSWIGCIEHNTPPPHHHQPPHPSSCSLSQQATRPPVPIMLPRWYCPLSSLPLFLILLSSSPLTLISSFSFISPPFSPPSLTVHYPNQIQQLNNHSPPLHELFFFFPQIPRLICICVQLISVGAQVRGDNHY